MFICPRCNESFNDASFSGWIVKVCGHVTTDDDGKIVSMSPLQAITTIKVGQELNAYQGKMACPHCRYESPVSKFPIVRRCRFTGESADMSISTRLGDFWVSSKSVALVHSIIARSSEWENKL